MASTSYTAVGNYTSTWASIYSLYFPPEIWNEWFQKYGSGFKVLDLLRMFGRVNTVADRDFYHYEDGTDQRVATTKEAITTGGAGATISFDLKATDYDSNGNGPLREHFTVAIPADYQPAAIDTPRLYVVTNIAGSGASQTYTCTPLSSDSQIATEVPAETELMIGPSVFAPGTGQPSGMASGTYRRSHSTHIIKETCGFEGGQIAQRNYREVVDKAGKPRIFDLGLVETEFRLDSQQDAALFFSEPNTNSLTQTSQAGGTPSRRSTKGLWQWMAELAQTKNYDDTFDMDDFDDIKPLLQSQGVIDATVLFAYGANLGLDVENGVLDGVKEWSGGTDLFKNKMFDVEVTKVKKNGVNFMFKEMVSFANPNKWGNSSYDFKDHGFMIPLTYASVSDEKGVKQVVPNLSLANYSHNGEDRSRIIGTVAGLNGLGYQIVNEYDMTSIYMLSEFAAFIANANQFIRVLKS